ncbi:MAG TPA: sulfurtransferase TusA family protein [Alphaproteobacteria bacterium]|nr:sulfurtransferase TusA family protein [Alphaproteobacteria bacterium]
MVRGKGALYFIDVSTDVCPLTFVRVKLLLESMPSGEACEIRLKAGEALRNVPRSAREHGHEVVSIAAEDPADPAGPHRIVIRKS